MYILCKIRYQESFFFILLIKFIFILIFIGLAIDVYLQNYEYFEGISLASLQFILTLLNEFTWNISELFIIIITIALSGKIRKLNQNLFNIQKKEVFCKYF